MKKTVAWLLSLVLLVGVIAGATVLYNNLSKEYEGENLNTDFGDFLMNTETNDSNNHSSVASSTSESKKTDFESTSVSSVTNNTESVSTESVSTENESTQSESTRSESTSSEGVTSESTQQTTATETTESESTQSQSTATETTESESTQSQSTATETTVTQSSKPEDHRLKAPDFTVLDENGNAVKLSDFRGKPIVLNFWATWCYYCKVEMPDFNQAYEKYSDIQFLMVNATDGVNETIDGVKKFVADAGYDFDVFFDTEYHAINAYHVTGFPSTFFIDAEGYLIARASGMINYATLEKGISMIRNQ